MEHYTVILFLLAFAVGVSALAPRTRIPNPVLLMLAGICVGFVPGFHYLPVSPDVVFLLFLPPLLYDAAINLPFPEFRKNIGTISMLAVAMVLITMAAIAVITRLLIPGVDWPAAFVIGAILSPPDAIAAESIIKNMKLPGRTKVILEGESLVNDATALTAYRIAVAVVAGGSFVFWKAGVEFLAVIVGGAAVGAVMAWLFVSIVKKVPFTSTATVCLNVILPFAAYELAESLDASGVIAVVVVGLWVSRQVHRSQLFTMVTAVQSKSVWAVIVYFLNGVVFILIGLEFPQAWTAIPRSSVAPLIVSSFAVFLTALVVRIAVLFERKYRQDRFEYYKSRGKECEKFPCRTLHYRTLDWKNILLVGWSGMRGIVSIATAIGLPVFLDNGQEFALRNEIIFLTVVVVILMLLIQGLGLPVLIRMLHLKTDDDPVEM